MTNKYNGSSESIYIKLAALGALITGCLGILLAIDSISRGNEMGAGVLLMASALAFGLMIFAYGLIARVERHS